jgi:hypothetical protein
MVIILLPELDARDQKQNDVRLRAGVSMAPRAYWKGYLKLSLVSCPIALYPASSSAERVSFNRINKKTGNRLKQQNVDAETGDPVDKEDIGRGYEIAKGQYLLVDDEELEKIQIESMLGGRRGRVQRDGTGHEGELQVALPIRTRGHGYSCTKARRSAFDRARQALIIEL